MPAAAASSSSAFSDAGGDDDYDDDGDDDDGGSASTGPPRDFPKDFPELWHWTDAKQVLAATKGAADSLTKVDLSRGVFGWWKR